VAPPEVEEFVAAVDHGAVGVASVDRRDVSSFDGDDAFVEQRDPFGDIAEVDEAASFADLGKRDELSIAEPLSCLAGAGEHRGGAGEVTGREDTAGGGGVVEVARLDTVELCVVDESPGSFRPTAGSADVTLEPDHGREARTEAHRSDDVAGGGGVLVGAGPVGECLFVAAG
jgi:hypothetical protein